MNKLIAAIMGLVLISAMTLPAAAQERDRYYSNQAYSRDYNRGRNSYDNRRDSRDYDRNGYYNSQQRGYYDYYDNRSFWQKHRDKLTTAGGVLGGAVLGGAIGGGRGAAIGALLGGAGSALYTYKLRDRYHRY